MPFSTYQSIEVIARVQQELLASGFPAFDLIICDEAHRTTGVTLAGKDESAFVKVHEPDFLKAKRRLYMTATPRLYTDDAKEQAKQKKAKLYSMDEKEGLPTYGPEIYRIGFGEAVERAVPCLSQPHYSPMNCWICTGVVLGAVVPSPS